MLLKNFILLKLKYVELTATSLVFQVYGHLYGYSQHFYQSGHHAFWWQQQKEIDGDFFAGTGLVHQTLLLVCMVNNI